MSVFSKTDKTKSPNYQPGIDGLRAVAVLLVLIFHVGFDFLPGGFVGVDVFFVISGYLITGIIYDQMNNDRFNYIQFILARISRLYPALLFTLVFVFIGCFLLYSPNDFIDVSRSAIYALFSASNMFFANSAGYFDTSSEINPLLHTWSLGVEQQFYLIWPIMIASVFFIRKTLVPVLLLIVTVASVIASQWATQNMPTESYYWMPFRVFELSIGGLSFFVSRKVKIGGGLKEIMMALGVMMIISSAIIFSSATQFPGFNALLPVAGAALCILSHDSRYFGLIVNNKISVGVGIVSYSVYLIHWPIIIIYKYWVFRELRNIEKCSIIALSIIIGVMMYYLVENKFRKIKIYKSSVESAFFISCLLIVLLSFSSSIKLNGFPYRISDSSASLYSNSKKYHSEFFGGGDTPQGRVVLGDDKHAPSFIILGDSFARQFALAINNDLIKSSKSAIAYFQDGCYLSSDYSRIKNGNPLSNCNEVYNNAVAEAKSTKLPVIYSQRWIGYIYMIGGVNGEHLKFNGDSDYGSFLVKNISILNSQIPGKLNVLLASNGVSNTGTSGVLACVNRPSYLPLICRENMAIKLGSTFTDRINNYIEENSPDDVNVISVDKPLCKKGICYPVSDDGDILYSDSVHLTKKGSKIVWDSIKNSLELK